MKARFGQNGRDTVGERRRAERLVRAQLPPDTVDRLALAATVGDDDAVAVLAGLPFGSRALLVAHGALDGGDREDVIAGRRAATLTRFGRRVLTAASEEAEARQRGVSQMPLDALGQRVRAAAANATAAAAEAVAATADRLDTTADRLDRKGYDASR